jgi:hypothetical protein
MKHRVVWPIVALLAIGLVVLSINSVSAQRDGDRGRPMERMGSAPHAGRFVVAHALAERIVILDTATGQLYVAGEKDMKKVSELPKVATPEDRIRSFRDEGKRGFFRKKDKEADEPPKKKVEKEDPS